MIPRAVFLDIDGVLNHHNWKIEKAHPFDPACMKHLNVLIARSKAKIVVSSAWRYLIVPDSMTVKGFENMLRTHGFKHQRAVIARTCLDYELVGRGAQISRWLGMNPCQRYVVLDDMEVSDHPLVQTNGNHGLTQNDVMKALEVLRCSTKRLVTA